MWRYPERLTKHNTHKLVTVIKFALQLYLVPRWICYAKTPQQNEAVIRSVLPLEREPTKLCQGMTCPPKRFVPIAIEHFDYPPIWSK